jgi:hypothetical protein
LLENLKGRDHSEDLGVDLKTLIELILEKFDGKVWIHLAQDRNLRQSVVNMVINLRVS